MLKRIITIFCVLLLLMVGLQSCESSVNYYKSMNVQTVNGKPYLVLGSEHPSTEDHDFSIFRPKDKNPAEWEAVSSELLGEPIGVYGCKVAKPERGSAERLGVFYRGSSTLFDISQNGV